MDSTLITWYIGVGWTSHLAEARLLETASWTKSWTLVKLRSTSLPGMIPAAALTPCDEEGGVPIGLGLLQTASSQDRELGSDPLGLTFHPGPWH